MNVKESDDAIVDEEIGVELDDTENQPSTSKVKDEENMKLIFSFTFADKIQK